MHKKYLISVSNLVGPAAFRPGHILLLLIYTPLVEKGRPVLQGLLAIDFLAKEAS
jgi:exocyst complex component 4